ncbi:pentatricopeptide repeat-containing protein At3g24000, mitochondrial-like [Vigna unguiculata]|uniref:Structure-specific endonuclease subunit SLX1 n=1 Tax=Vigna unguiculata TaxID=3917 RepID=A0A4D6L5H4_VIGUN|nr:pentatricopeptide repeat-containing protein At3g24000, mitochondrial-like [Vigna unguiculata]XP_027916847.1 pentatricopeptide repeat-containing protein At3g24000, mitochondrial-like [Vigna unguiculata]QCD83684.1 structure-specific endonuclease subunit SLX1 [Vigna unguiculata]
MVWCDEKEKEGMDPRAMHARAIRSESKDRAVWNKLITNYSKSNLSSYARSLFHHLPRPPNVVSWSALISGHSNTLFSLRHFLAMLRYPTLPNHRILASLFESCATVSALSFALSLHSLAFKLALARNPFTASSLLSLYSKFRMPFSARKVFDDIPHPDNVCFSALVIALAQNSRSLDALSVFSDMARRGFASTIHSVSGGLRAAGQLASLEQCKMMHAHVIVAGFDTSVVVGSALVNGYGKAGVVSDARRVFEDSLSDMNIVAWNALMAAYAQQGDYKSAFELFESMEGCRLVPDGYSFLAILTALCNAGMFRQIDQWFTRMIVNYGLEPSLEHCTCLVGAIARTGEFDRAERVVLNMPFEPDAAVWRALLSACSYLGEADRAWYMAKRVLELEPHDPFAYIVASNVLSSVGRWDDVAELRKMIKDRRAKKVIGRSWIEVQGEVHVFVAADWKHKRSKEIYQKLQELMGDIEKLGYVPVLDEVLHNVEEEKRKEALWYHSEKLAVAFGVLCGSALPGKPLRIVKNLRICKDCHEAFKYMTRVLEREIIVRDVNRYHRFVNGNCTCRDTW